MKKLLILFANGFPYGNHEPFLENEIPLYKEYFDKVLLLSPCHKGEIPTREVHDSLIEIIPDYTLSKDLKSVLEAIPWLLNDGMFYRELLHWLLHERFSFRKLYYTIVYSLCANHLARQAFHWLKKNTYNDVLLYSYWMSVPAYAAVRLNHHLHQRFYSISRAHGADLYLERHKTVGHLPFHKQIYHQLHEIASISSHGKQYLEDKYGNHHKVSIHRLGAVDQQCRNPDSMREVLEIVTCSRTVPLKRLDRLVDTLALIHDKQIHWTHLGGGEAQKSLEKYAEEKLPANISVTFSDTIPNTKVYQYYQEHPFHVFINVSETEGVPVAIMEAMSFGIPVIATAVGGTPELVDHEKNGYLLPADFTNEELLAYIRLFADMSESDYAKFRQEARTKFETDYNAITNYRNFLDYLSDK